MRADCSPLALRAVGNWRRTPSALYFIGVVRPKLRRYGEVAVKFTRITHSPAVMGGKPCIRGLRVTVGTIVGLLAAGESRGAFLAAYPYLEPADLDEALAYAAWRLEEREEELVIP